MSTIVWIKTEFVLDFMPIHIVSKFAGGRMQTVRLGAMTDTGRRTTPWVKT